MTDPSRLPPGYVIQDTYEIEELLGEGGMGATYRGRNRANGQTIAVKVVSERLARDERALKLFGREAHLLSTVRHDAVVRYETIIQDRSGRLFLILEFVAGRPLSDYVRKSARLPSLGVLQLGERLAGGLDAIHRLGIVHRDVSPDNIIVPDDDVRGAKLIDFGLASGTIGTDKSIIGASFAGKISYCAPEQLGLFDGRVTAATDAYALGLVLLRVAGLPVPGEGEGFAGAMAARRADLAVEDPRLSAPLARTLRALLRADPAARPTDLPALFRDTLAAPEVEVEPSPDPVIPFYRRPAALGAAAAAALLLAAVGTVYWPRGGGVEPESTAHELAEAVLSAPDPIEAVKDLFERGDTVSLNAALGALMRLADDASASDANRQCALVMVAEMYDPITYNAARSPFPQADASAAGRYWQRAADLGESSECAERISHGVAQ